MLWALCSAWFRTCLPAVSPGKSKRGPLLAGESNKNQFHPVRPIFWDIRFSFKGHAGIWWMLAESEKVLCWWYVFMWPAAPRKQAHLTGNLHESVSNEAWGTPWLRHRKPAQFVLVHSSWSLCFIVGQQQELRFFSHCSCATIYCTGFFSGFCRSSQRGCFIDFIDGKTISLQKPLWQQGQAATNEALRLLRVGGHTLRDKYAAPLHRETVLRKFSWLGQIAKHKPGPNRAACRFAEMDIEVTPSLDSFCTKHCLFWDCLCQGKRFGIFWMTHVWCTE